MKFKYRHLDLVLYQRWQTMKSRCYNPNAQAYDRYGMRGIRICEEWLNYDNFYIWAINNGYDESLTLERIDNNGNYCPSNCKFIPPEEQAKNTRKTLYLTAFNETKTIIEWSKDKRCLASLKAMYNRWKFGWEHERIITEPIEDYISTSERIGKAHTYEYQGETKSIRRWALDSRCEVSRKTLMSRLKDGTSIEKALKR